MISLNGGYAMIKYNSTQEELQIAYRSKKPVLCYDENRRAHWAVIEETATESVDEETQEPITIYEYSYRLIDEASGGSKSYLHKISITFSLVAYGTLGYISLLITNSNNTPIGKEFFDTLGYNNSNNLCYITGFIDNTGSSSSYKDKYIVIGFYVDNSSWKLGLKLLTLSDLSIINVNSYYSKITDTITEV